MRLFLTLLSLLSTSAFASTPTVTKITDQLSIIEAVSTPSTGYFWQLTGLDKELYVDRVEQISTPFDSTNPWIGGSEITRYHIVGDYRKVSASALSLSRVSHSNAKHYGYSSIQVSYSYSDLPTSYDLCALGGCTPVRSQKEGCGSCWAFATVAPLDSAVTLLAGTNRDHDFSEQYLISCNAEGYGCNGGWLAHDYHLVNGKKVSGELESGAVDEESYPYVAKDSACVSPNLKSAKLSKWVYVTGEIGMPTVDQIKQALLDHGLLAVTVCVDADFASYGSGVLTGPGCDNVNHGVAIVGWDDALGAWKVRNSWGASWGEGGYVWMQYGVSMIGYAATYVVLDEVQPVEGNVGCSTAGNSGFSGFLMLFALFLVVLSPKFPNGRKV